MADSASSDERIMTIPLRKGYTSVPRNRKAKKAVFTVRSHLARHMKVDESDIMISQAVNSAIWSRGIQKPPARIRIKVRTGEEGKIVAMLPEEKVEIKSDKSKKPSAEKKEDSFKTAKETVSEAAPSEPAAKEDASQEKENSEKEEPSMPAAKKEAKSPVKQKKASKSK